MVRESERLRPFVRRALGGYPPGGRGVSSVLPPPEVSPHAMQTRDGMDTPTLHASVCCQCATVACFKPLGLSKSP
jgi:hypothetical protein